MGCILKSYGDEVKKIYMLDSVYSKIALNDDEKLNYIKSNVNAAFSNNKILSIINVFSDDLIDLYKQAYFYKIEDSLSYVPSYFDGDVFMFKAIGKQKNQDNLNLKRDLDNGYGKFAKHMYIKELPFTHTELMDEKPAKIIADEILKDMLLE